MEPNISRDIWVEVNKCIILSNDSGISYNLGCLSDNPSENLPDNEENSSDNGNSNNNLPQKEPDKKKVYSLQFYITKSNTISVVQYDGCRYGSPTSTGWITYSGVYQFEVPHYANAYNALKQSVANVESMYSKCNNNSQQTGCIALSNPASRIQAVVSNWQPETMEVHYVLILHQAPPVIQITLLLKALIRQIQKIILQISHQRRG